MLYRTKGDPGDAGIQGAKGERGTYVAMYYISLLNFH